MRPSSLFLCLLLAMPAVADLNHELHGHTKLRVVGQSFPSDSLFNDVVGGNTLDATADLRLNLTSRAGRWRFNADYQLVGLRADTLPLTGLPGDERRLFDLTHVISSGSNDALLHRLDRISIGYTTEKTVVRLGRQALSWGNGLFYAPMDLVNPFDPASIDTEYKSGDDMLYLQFLRDSGDDVQAAWVARRDPVTGNATDNEATIAAKYHGFVGTGEYDVLVAQSYGDTVIGIGAGRGFGGSVWSADLVVTRTDLDTYAQFVTNLSYSWVWSGKNMTGAVEYYFNGFGQDSGRYDPVSLAANPDLLVRLERGELFALGRHYLAGSVTIEMTPLWTVSPVLLTNLTDPSALLQLVTNYSLGDNLTLLGSINLPLGANGSEFGGIESGLPDRYLSNDAGLFAQFAWYF